MMKCKMKRLALALGTVLGGMSMIPSAQAISLATDGLGQALVFPYYTTRAGWNTLLNVTNTSNQIVVMKVRFHEAYNSRDVFDFNVIMSPYDVWNGTLTNGPGNIPVFSTVDTTCTVPAIPAGGQPFQGNGANATLAYTGTAADSGPTTIDRAREGYVSITMMGTAPTSDSLAAGAIHNAARVPANCNALRRAFSLDGMSITTLRSHFGYTGNPLKGAFSLVNAANGWNASGEAVTFANVFNPALPPTSGSTLINNLITAQLPPASVNNVYYDSFHEPNLGSTNTAGVYLGVDDSLQTSPVASGADAAQFVIARQHIVNQWANRSVATTGWEVHSDWVITFPTKRYYTDRATNEFSGRASGRLGLPATHPAPFAQYFAKGQSCDPVDFKFYDREEKSPSITSGAVFSPAPTPVGDEICAEANVLSFGAGSSATATTVLGSPLGANRIAANVPTPPSYENGWMQLSFNNPLPVVGFAVINRTDPAGILNESYIVDHAYIRR